MPIVDRRRGFRFGGFAEDLRVVCAVKAGAAGIEQPQ
jgi:hypothetical protein